MHSFVHWHLSHYSNDSSQNLEGESKNEDNTFEDIYDNNFEQHNHYEEEYGEDNNDEANGDDEDNDYYDSEQDNEQDNISLFIQFSEEMGLRPYLQKNTGGSLSKAVTNSSINCFNKLLILYIRSLANNTAADNTTPIRLKICWIVDSLRKHAKIHWTLLMVTHLKLQINFICVAQGTYLL